jgi:hypothetical protein
MPYALGYFISLVRFFGYFWPIWLMRILPIANFAYCEFFPEPKVALGKNPL